MSTKMLISASRGGQLRVAIVDGTLLQEYQVEVAEAGLTRGNIYRGIVANIQPSLNAAFIDIGEERHGFLPVADVLPSAYHKQPKDDVRRPRVDQVLEKGKPILVQVTKDGVGQKGPALSSNIALAGRYLVLTPSDPVRGISRKAADDDARKKIRDRLKKLTLPEGHGTIVRTNGLEQNQQTLNRDLSALLRLWKRIRTEASRGRGPKLAYSDQDLVVQALRDYLDPGIEEVVVDNDEVQVKAEAFMKAFMPRSKTRLVRYDDRLPLFSRYRLETQIDRIYERQTSLPSGGSIVIDQTEALTAIDVNSGRATKTSNHDEAISKVNCEAAEEVARQLRLRDIGGLVVVDFIDMRLRKHQSRLEKVMRDSMKIDKARHSVGRISSNGLLEINRQRIKQALRLRTHRPCPTCSGVGTTPTLDFAALRLLARIEARAASGLVESVTLALHPEVADTLQNHFRKHLAAIEGEHQITIEVISGPNLGLVEERVEWVSREGAPPAIAAKVTRAINASDLTPTKRQALQDEKDGQDDDDNESSEGGRSSGRRRKRRRRRGRGGRDNDRDQSSQDQGQKERDQKAEGRKADTSGDSNSESKRGTRRRAASSDETSEQDNRDQSSDDGEEGAGRIRRRKRSRSRRRGGRSDGRTEGTSSDRAADDSSQSDDAAQSADAQKGDDSSGGGAEVTTTRRRSRRGRGRRRRGQSDDGSQEESTSQDAASELSEEGSEPDQQASGKDDDARPVRRRRTSRRRSKSESSSKQAESTGDVAEQAESQERSASDRSKDDALKSGAEAKSAEAKSVEAAQGDEDDKPRTRRRRSTRSRARKAETETNSGDSDSSSVADSGKATGSGEQKDDHAYDRKQPVSNESALHRDNGSVDPTPQAADEGDSDREVSSRLRWQWWGGGPGAQETGGEEPTSSDEPSES